MAPLPIETLPLLHRAHMKSIRQCLADLNLRTFGDVADSPLPALRHCRRKVGRPLAALGERHRPHPVMPPPAQPALTYSQVLQPDTNDDRILPGTILPICLRTTLPDAAHSDNESADGSR